MVPSKNLCLIGGLLAFSKCIRALNSHSQGHSCYYFILSVTAMLSLDSTRTENGKNKVHHLFFKHCVVKRSVKKPR